MITTTTKAQRFQALIIYVRAHVARARRRGAREQDEVINAVRKSARRRFLQDHDLVEEQFIRSTAMTTKQARARGIETETGQFVLEELFIVHSDQGTLQLARGELTLKTGDQLTAQREKNARMINRALRSWQWEWKQVVRPVLAEHAKHADEEKYVEWTFTDAYRHLLTNGGIPESPDFGDDEE